MKLVRALVGCLLAVAAVVAFTAPSAAASTLAVGGTLAPGASITSPNGSFRAIMQGDGNFVVYQGGKAIWNTRTWGNPGATVQLQTDGNLVVRKGSTALWNSKTGGAKASSLSMQNDGNLVISLPDGRASWSSKGGVTGDRFDRMGKGRRLVGGQYLKSADGRFRAIMQGDGNFVVYEGGTARWNTRTSGRSGAYIVFQGDSNLVLYSGGKAYWNSKTAGRTGATVSLQNDGNLVMRTSGGTAIWSWKTGVIGGSTTTGADDYPWKSGDPSALSPLGFAYRNCTDFAAWKINKARGGSATSIKFSWGSLAFPGGDGNARGWKDGAARSGFAVNDSPAVGAVAWWGTSVGTWGHVAIVTAVASNGTVTVAEYNWTTDYGYGTRSGIRAEKYLHIK